MIWELFCYTFVFAAEGVTAWTYFEHIFQRKSRNLTAIFSFVIGYILLFFVSQSNSVLFNGIAYVLINYLLVHLNYYSNKASGLLQVGYLTLVMGGTEILVILLLSVFTGSFDTYYYDTSVKIILAVFSRLFFFFTMQISAHFLSPVKTKHQDVSSILLLSVLPISSTLIIAAFIYVGLTIQTHVLIRILMTLSVIALMIVNVLVVIINNHIQKLYEEKLTLQLEMQKEATDAEYYSMLQKQYENQKLLIHDIRNHLYAMETMASKQQNQDLEKYVSLVLDDPGLQNMVNLCDNQTLNMILIRYFTVSKENGIDFHYDVRKDSLKSLNHLEITALFGNLLSNAVEAAINSKDKTIDLSVVKNQGILITLINSCDIAPTVNADGSYKTSKKDTEKHGVGMKSIKRIVESHQGIYKFYYDAEAKQFHSVIRFPD